MLFMLFISGNTIDKCFTSLWPVGNTARIGGIQEIARPLVLVILYILSRCM